MMNKRLQSIQIFQMNYNHVIVLELLYKSR